MSVRTERILYPIGEYNCKGCGEKVGERVQIGEDGPVALRIGGSATLWLEAHSGICMHCGANVQWSAGTVKMSQWLSLVVGRAVSTDELEVQNGIDSGQ